MSEQPCEPMGDVTWLEIPATNMTRSQTFYKTVFGWEFATPPGTPEGFYSMFSKPNTKLAGGLILVKEADIIQPTVDSQGCGQTTVRLTIRVEDVTSALKSVEDAGGKVVWYGSAARVSSVAHRDISSAKKDLGNGMGFTGVFRDTEGNITGVWSNK